MPFKIKQCKNCGIDFEPKTTLQSCCNILCTQEYSRKRKLLKIKKDKIKHCLNCGKEFTIEKGTKSYCNAQCAYERQRKVACEKYQNKKKLKSPSVKKPKKQSISTLKNKAWKIFSNYIRTRDCIAYSGGTEYGKCVTCNKIYPIKQLQAGHFIDGRTKLVLFNEEIVFSQCMGCNVFKKGAKDDYAPFMINRYGIDKVNEFYDLRHNKDKTWTQEELEQVVDTYTKKLAELAQSAIM